MRGLRMIVLGEARPKGNGTRSDNYSLAKDCNTPALEKMFSLPFLLYFALLDRK
jgi:hypothetical protein